VHAKVRSSLAEMMVTAKKKRQAVDGGKSNYNMRTRGKRDKVYDN
jgi:hypothetical protein